MTPLVVDVIREAPALERLGPEWQALLARSSSDRLFSTFEWLHTWWQHLGAGRRLCVRTVRRGGELVAIAPFVMRAATTTAHPAFGCIELLGAGAVGSDYGDLVVARDCEAECLEALARHLASEHHVFAFRRLRDESCLLGTLCRRLGQQRFIVETRPDELSPYVRFESRSFEGYLATLSHGHRHAFRRYRRALERKHEVAFDTVRSEAERGPALASFLALHAARWRARGDVGAFARPELLAFHEAMSALALRRGWLRLQLLRLDGRAVAAVYGFRYGDVFYYYQTGFDPAFAADSVGLVA
ncbi:MAG: GNAT family N-acetyltransferase, partial [Polyangiaceae bacterium]|nr:GNAT family N-acetyltransferase [Polyangiaceae bacterium]